MLTIVFEGDRSDPFGVTLEKFAPALAKVSGSEANLGLILRPEDSSLINFDNLASPEDVLRAFATGMGPTAPTVPTGEGVTEPIPTISTPTVRLGCFLPQILFSGLTRAPGSYQVNFAVPQSAPGGNHPLKLETGGHGSNEVRVPVSGGEVPAVCGAVSAASFEADASVVGGSILSLFAMNIGEEENLAVFPQTEFNGISVTFNGLQAPLFAVVPSSQQINVLVPNELPETGESVVRITNEVGESAPFSVPMTSASPGIFRLNDPSGPGRVFAATVLAGTRWFALPDLVAEALGLPTNCAEEGIDPASYCAQPVAPGDVLEVFVTGLGRATAGADPTGAVLRTGEVAPPDGDPLFETIMQPEVKFANVATEVLFAGLVPGFSGLYQINVTVPGGTPTGDAALMTVSMSNGRSDSAAVAVGPRAAP